MTLDVLTFNLNNPGRPRAERQFAFLTSRPEPVLVLTETAPSAGCDWLAQQFTEAGYHVEFPQPERGERGVMLVSRLALAPSDTRVDYLPHRAVAAYVETDQGPVEVIGLYVPSRDTSPVKVARKQRFLRECCYALPSGHASQRVVIGDHNVIEPHHQPRYPFFRRWEYDFYKWFAEAGYVDAFRRLHPYAAEYSWVGRTGDGYRYDHVHVSESLTDTVRSCLYIHEPRTMETRLTDHSALTVQLDLTPVFPPPAGDSEPTEADPAPALS